MGTSLAPRGPPASPLISSRPMRDPASREVDSVSEGEGGLPEVDL